LSPPQNSDGGATLHKNEVFMAFPSHEKLMTLRDNNTFVFSPYNTAMARICSASYS
jgi:hypothetical protein